MIDLLNCGAYFGQDTGNATYKSDGHMAVLLQRIPNRDFLRLEVGGKDEVNLDSAVWRQRKVKEKTVQFLSALAEKKITNRVVRAGFRVLGRDKFISTGLEGNLMKELLEEGYSPKTARSEASQTITMFRLLKIIGEENNKVSLPNKQSMILRRVKGAL